MKIKYISIFIIIFSCMAFCIYEIQNIEQPSHFPNMEYDLLKNPISKNKIELGRALFYDPILSKDNSISCASCHSPYNAFSHTDHDLSHGINDEIGTRNAPALFNLAWHKTFMWDGAIQHLDMQALAPISHPKEMGEDIKSVVNKLQKTLHYPSLFHEAFQDSIITGEFVLKALSQFQLSLVSARAKYDQVKMNKDTFTIQEENGYQLFKENCNSCHTEPLFFNNQFANNGLSIDTTLNDFGKWMITGQSVDSLIFKVPTLRNLKYTYPYMHDGRFKKLRQVLNHYTEEIQESPTLSKELENPIQLNENEKVDLITFLLTLNDKDFVFNPKHQFPRKK